MAIALVVFTPIAAWDAGVDWFATIEERRRDGVGLPALAGAVVLGLVLTNLGAIFYSGVIGEAASLRRSSGR